MPYKERDLAIPMNEWLFENIEDPLLFVDAYGNVVRHNQGVLQFIKNIQKGPIHTWFDFNRFKEQEEASVLLRIKDGSDRLFHVRSKKMKIDGDQKYYAVFLRLVSLTDQVQELKDQMNQLTHERSEGMVLHKQGEFVDCDLTFERMFGYSKEELHAMEISSFIDEASQADLEDMLDSLPDRPFLLKAVKKDSTRFYIEVLAHPFVHGDEVLRIAIIRDVTQRIETEQKMEFMAYYDELTNLPNHHYFKSILNHTLEQEQNLAVHFINLDYFKQVNDTLGYQFGDRLLQSCAERLKKLLDTNVFIAHMGGDEFLILQRGVTSKKEAEEMAASLVEAFRVPITIEEHEIYTSISIGISMYPQNGKTAEELIKQADSAMYHVKGNNRDHYKCYEPSISKRLETQLSVETALRKAVKENQLEIHYQPQKCIVSEEVVGLEALVRWNHPEQGMISPGLFIPVAEKTGLICEIGEWVMREACMQNKKWQELGFKPVVVGVNLSATQFHQKDLVSKVKKILDESGLEPKYLELEITESMAVSNEEYIIRTLKELREEGVLVSIDDFGTGYSSLKYLSRFPVSKLKIDRIFIDENRKQNKAIVKSIIHMSHSLDMKVIAEGVETNEQLDFLRQERCDEIQGFLYSKPLPPVELEEIFQQNTYH
ncbi:GGDEF and EAL domain-containing protein [Halobacillus yeomjeoni]|uniref:EAL domain-containing protein n=1 Tax=Halobacillus yeomjeoni TaxID=311194 RepID=A0A931HSI3_9BACI|nr:GGDEF and EAL domain-containing protein [Halobacillus yeomjeoni]MBH0228935.1 EAL domain-containing protein [Halobacillus yeomjeoni]